MTLCLKFVGVFAMCYIDLVETGDMINGATTVVVPATLVIDFSLAMKTVCLKFLWKKRHFESVIIIISHFCAGLLVVLSGEDGELC
jgi:hypothetical protein